MGDKHVGEQATTGQSATTAHENLGKRPLLTLALLALALTASFYALLSTVVVLVLGAVWLALSQSPGWTMAVVLPLGVLFAAARHSLVAAMPRRPKRDLPGIAITRSEQPNLWALVDTVAAAASQPPLDLLRITLSGSAFATERGAGFSGRSQRVMGLPYSYLVALSQPELASVIAHELAHFAAGDTTLSRWLQTLVKAG